MREDSPRRINYDASPRKTHDFSYEQVTADDNIGLSDHIQVDDLMDDFTKVSDLLQRRTDEVARNTTIGPALGGSWCPDFIKVAMIAKQNPSRIKEIMDKFPTPKDADQSLIVPRIVEIEERR